MSAILNEVVVPTISIEECQDFHSTSSVTEASLCISTTGGHGICHVSTIKYIYFHIKRLIRSKCKHCIGGL